MEKILFVDDEKQILQGIKRLLRPMRDQWTVEYEESSRAALQRLESENFDVVVTDMKMPEFNGVDVLKHALEHCPNAIRIGLSGYADAELALEAAGVVHQFFAKPCELKELTEAIQRIQAVQQRLNNDDLKRQITAINELPTLPDIYTQIMAEASSPQGSLEGVGKIIGDDLGMTAKLLSIVNSPFFGLRNQSTSPEHAASLVGFDGIRAIVLTLGVFRAYENAEDAAFLKDLMDHSVRVSGFCGQLARQFGMDRREVDQCVLAGMLHDLGRLIIHCDIPMAAKTIKTMVSTGLMNEIEAEMDLLGCNHMDIGAYILSLWGFTNTVVEAVAFYHQPDKACTREEVDALTVLHIANALDEAAHGNRPAAELVDTAYLTSLELQPGTDMWDELSDAVVNETAA